MIECEISSHEAYGTPRELFVAVFGVIVASLRELLGACCRFGGAMDRRLQPVARTS